MGIFKKKGAGSQYATLEEEECHEEDLEVDQNEKNSVAEKTAEIESDFIDISSRSAAGSFIAEHVVKPSTTSQKQKRGKKKRRIKRVKKTVRRAAVSGWKYMRSGLTIIARELTLVTIAFAATPGGTAAAAAAAAGRRK